MTNWDDNDFKMPKASVPKDVFEGVKSKLAARRLEVQVNNRIMAVGAVLLLILGGVNMSILVSNLEENAKTMTEKAKILQDAYFL
jgi:hypothetical protein